MKNLMLVAIKDEKAGVFIGEVMTVRNEFEASRVINSFDNKFAKASKRDFQIYKIGEFDDENGITSCSPELLAKFISDEVEEESIEDSSSVNE